MTWTREKTDLSRIVAAGNVRIVENADKPRLIFPDYWWGDAWWMKLRDASHHRRELAKIELPPVPNEEQIKCELKTLLEFQASDERQRRTPEILEEDAGPPKYYARMLFLDDPGNSLTRSIVGHVIEWAEPPIMYFKHQFKRRRPPQLEPRLRPLIDVPRHPAYPSGHSTQSHLIALVVEKVTGRADIGTALWDAADRIAQNREYAGIHYPSDSLAGVALARALFPLFLSEFGKMLEEAHHQEWSGA